MVESKFAFFEMQKEVFAANATALRQTRFRRTPEALNAIDVDAAAPHKDTVAMFDAEMFPIAEVHQPVVADPAIGMNDAGQGDATANNAPQGGLFRVGDDLGIDAALAFEDAKHDRFAPAPRPRLPRMRRRPKYDSSTSIVPRTGACCSQTRAMRIRKA